MSKQLITPAQGFANFLDSLAFPAEPELTFPDDYEIICSCECGCEDAMVAVAYEELVNVGGERILRWQTTNYECRNCRGCEGV